MCKSGTEAIDGRDEIFTRSCPKHGPQEKTIARSGGNQSLLGDHFYKHEDKMQMNSPIISLNMA